MLWAAVDVKDKNCIAEIVEEGAQMRYLSAAVMAEKWHVSERSVRNYPKRRKTPSFSYGDIRRVSFAGSMPVKDTIQHR